MFDFCGQVVDAVGTSGALTNEDEMSILWVFRKLVMPGDGLKRLRFVQEIKCNLTTTVLGAVTNIFM